MLEELITALREHPAVRDKASISEAYHPALSVSQGIPIGDDCAAIPDGDGHLLFAAEGMLPGFVEYDPWFAGYSAVMVNLSDIAAMGGIPIAITDILWTSDSNHFEKIWQGMQAASMNYGIPIVGGHTTRDGGSTQTHLAAAVLGRAGKNLITSFDAEPGDDLVIAIDLNGAFQGDKPFWNASTTSSPEHLQKTLTLPRDLADQGLSKAGKDISNGGIVGTLAMLCECSQVGATLDLESIPKPEHTDWLKWLKWLTAFPSYGYLFATKPEHSETATQLFKAHGISAQKIGSLTQERVIKIKNSGEIATLIF